MTERRTEIYQDGRWLEMPFERIQVGDIFRLWEPVIEKNEELNADVIAWKCKAPPEKRDGTFGCDCTPALTLPKPTEVAAQQPSDIKAEESAEQQGG